MSDLNSEVFSIRPYRLADGGWCFSDESRGINDEPFVLGIPEILDALAAKVKAKGWLDLRFSARLFRSREPKKALEMLFLVGEENGGAWYLDATTMKKGWLCPVVHVYFPHGPPRVIFIEAAPWDPAQVTPPLPEIAKPS